jgi:hypothetical protein
MKNGRFHKNDLRQKFVTCVRYGLVVEESAPAELADYREAAETPPKGGFLELYRA